MLLNANKFSDPDGVIHWAWLHSRVTFCGVSKTHWRYPFSIKAPVTCKACANEYVVVSLDEAHSDNGFAIADQESA